MLGGAPRRGVGKCWGWNHGCAVYNGNVELYLKNKQVSLLCTKGKKLVWLQSKLHNYPSQGRASVCWQRLTSWEDILKLSKHGRVCTADKQDILPVHLRVVFLLCGLFHSVLILFVVGMIFPSPGVGLWRLFAWICPFPLPVCNSHKHRLLPQAHSQVVTWRKNMLATALCFRVLCPVWHITGWLPLGWWHTPGSILQL